MASQGHGRARSLSNESDRPPKRISTPAGLRLSVIMESTIDQKSRPYRGSKTGPFPGFSSGFGSSKGSTLVEEDEEQSKEEHLKPIGYTYNISSEKVSVAEPRLTPSKKFTPSIWSRRGGWKRMVIIAAILLICIIAIIVGVVVGLQQQRDNKSNEAATTSNNAESANVSASSASSTSGSGSGSGVGSVPASTSVPSNFPAGTYSFSTFLDTVTTDCTSNPSTWTCFPYTIYNDNKIQALATFNWIIKKTGSDTYSISSTNNPFAIDFEDTNLKIVDKGGDNERYQFQISMEKSVVPSAPISEDITASTCYYNATTLTGYLYTKRAKDYPSASDAVANASYPAWPFAVRVEQTAAGGEGVPECYQTSNGQPGALIEAFNASDPTTLCSCLYRNFLTKT